MPEQSMTFSRALDRLDWYRRCLEDIQDGRSVTGLREAKLGYDDAMQWLKSEPRTFRVTYRTNPDDDGLTGNYVDVKALSAADAVVRRLAMLGGKGSCSDAAGFECDGEWFPVRWDRTHWALAELTAMTNLQEGPDA